MVKEAVPLMQAPPSPPATPPATRPSLRSTLAILFALVAVVAALSYHFWSTQQFEDTIGRVVLKEVKRESRLDELVAVKQPIAFLYCHLTPDSPVAAEWLASKRAQNDEESMVQGELREWRDHRCLSPFGMRQTVYALDATFVSYNSLAERMHEALRNTPNLSDWLRPRVAEVFIDSFNELYYRVLIPYRPDKKSPARIVPALVSHLNLLYVLKEWRDNVTSNVGAGAVGSPCICAAHVGMLASGLYFTVDRRVCPTGHTPLRAYSPWVIWADLRRDHVTESSGFVAQRQEFYSGWHPFPFIVNQRLWPRSQEDMMSIPLAIHFTGYDPEMLYDNNTLLAQVPTASAMKWREYPGTGDRLFRWSEQEYLLRVPLAQTTTARTCRPTAEGDLPFSRCIAYCDALDRYLLRQAGVA